MEITFEKGLPGFENYKTFKISEVEDNTSFKTITSTEEKNIGFIAVSPFDIKKDYELDIDEETVKLLKIETYEDVLVLNLVTLGNSLANSTVNLKAPIIINIKNNKGKQLILQNDSLKIKEPLTGSDRNVSNY
ncbi:MAG: flagellar assembly protein FliW [Paraclostridium sp.]|uniref:flagellar assembly protein FliW n=1 Tax=Paraclostridium sp. TaxID=2023273 RepID=UPI003F39F1D9